MSNKDRAISDLREFFERYFPDHMELYQEILCAPPDQSVTSPNPPGKSYRQFVSELLRDMHHRLGIPQYIMQNANDQYDSFPRQLIPAGFERPYCPNDVLIIGDMWREISREDKARLAHCWFDLSLNRGTGRTWRRLCWAVKVATDESGQIIIFECGSQHLADLFMSHLKDHILPALDLKVATSHNRTAVLFHNGSQLRLRSTQSLGRELRGIRASIIRDHADAMSFEYNPFTDEVQNVRHHKN